MEGLAHLTSRVPGRDEDLHLEVTTDEELARHVGLNVRVLVWGEERGEKWGKKQVK